MLGLMLGPAGFASKHERRLHREPALAARSASDSGRPPPDPHWQDQPALRPADAPPHRLARTQTSQPNPSGMPVRQSSSLRGSRGAGWWCRADR